MSEPGQVERLPLAVLVQPDPMLEERAGPFRTLAAMAAAAVVVVLVLYGLSRPPQEPQMASAPSAATQNAPAGSGTANNAAAQPQQPATTGSGQASGQPGQNPPAQKNQPNQNQASQPPAKQGDAKPAARSDSATTGQGSAPSDKAAPKTK